MVLLSSVVGYVKIQALQSFATESNKIEGKKTNHLLPMAMKSRKKVNNKKAHIK